MFQDIVQTIVDEELRTRGVAPEYRSKISTRSFKRVETELSIGTENAEYTTVARAAATASLRNFISHAVMVYHQIAVRSVPRPLMLNPDGSCYTVGYRNNQQVHVKFLKSEKDISDFAMKFSQCVPKKGDTFFGAYTIRY